jgi:hypothetical protein
MARPPRRPIEDELDDTRHARLLAKRRMAAPPDAYDPPPDSAETARAAIAAMLAPPPSPAASFEPVAQPDTSPGTTISVDNSIPSEILSAVSPLEANATISPTPTTPTVFSSHLTEEVRATDELSAILSHFTFPG